MQIDKAVDEIFSKILTPYLPEKLNMFIWGTILLIWKQLSKEGT